MRLLTIGLISVFALILLAPTGARGEEPPAGQGAPVVKVLSPGAEPRQALRYEGVKDYAQDIEMVTKMGISMSMADNPMPSQNIPPMKMVIAVVVEGVSENGDISYGAKFTEAGVVAGDDVDPMMAGAMNQALGAMKGLEMDVVVDSRGATKSSTTKNTEQLPPQLQQTLGQMEGQMQQMSAPFPEEPVGVGAKWKVHQSIETNGMSIKQVATYELVAINGSKLTLNVSITQGGEEQNLDLPQLPPGASAKLLSLSGSGSGKMVVDLSQIGPVSSSMKLQSDTSMEIDVGTGPQAMSTETKIEMNLSSTAPKPITATTPR